MKYFQTFDKFYLLLAYPVLRLTVPYLQYRLRSWTLIPFFLLWLLYVFRTRQSLIRDRAMDRYFLLTSISLLLYGFLPLLYEFLGSVSIHKFHWLKDGSSMMIFLFMFSVAHYSLKFGKIKELKFLTVLLFVGFSWMAISALRAGETVMGMGGARMLSSLSMEGAIGFSAEYVQEAMELVEVGVGTSGSTYVSAFAIPMLIYSLFHVKTIFFKVICAVMAYANYINIKYSGLNTPYMIACMGVALCFFGRFLNWRKKIVLVGSISAICVLVFSYHPTMLSFASKPLLALADATEAFPQFSWRCASMADAFAGYKDTYAYERYQLQVKSFDSFIKGNWVLGSAFGEKAEVGGHSEMLDGLARYGIVSLVLIVMFFYSYLRYCNQVRRLFFGNKWAVLPYIYAGAWIFSSVPNPSYLGTPIVILLIPGLALFFKEFEDRWRGV